MNDVLYSIQRGNDYCPVPVPIFEHQYRESYGIGAFLDLDLVTMECKGIRKTSRSFDREFLELNLLFMLGNEIAEVLNKRGGIILLTNLVGTYKSVTSKNLDPTNYGFDKLENLIRELDLFVKITGKKKSVVLRSIHHQMSERMNQDRQSTEREDESEYATADEVNIMGGASGSSPLYRHNIKPDIIGETHQRQERRPNEEAVNQPTFSARMDHLARGLHPTVSPALKSLRQEQLFKSRKLKLTSFVNTKTQTWQGRIEGDKYTMEIRHEQDIPAVDDEGCEYSTNTPGEIITIEDSMSEAESMPADLNTSILSVSSSTSNTSGRGRRKSRLAANFSGNEH